MTERGLPNAAPKPVTAVERRLLAEYGAIFVTRATPPPVIAFHDEASVAEFQTSLTTSKQRIGDFDIELQSEAMEALLLALAAAERLGLTISARCPDSGRRSYAETVSLWTRNVERGLDNWVKAGRLQPAAAAAIRSIPPKDQVQEILDLETKQELYFGTFFDKSILYSVAAPGASHHLSMLALDIAQYRDPAVERALAGQGWFRTVPADLPHFTYLGSEESALETLGLRQTVRFQDGRTYRFWTLSPTFLE